jgi:predicted membrane channel-forming protein YqfA (hemolysin III family)
VVADLVGALGEFHMLTLNRPLSFAFALLGTLFCAYVTHYAAKHGGEVFVFLGVTLAVCGVTVFFAVGEKREVARIVEITLGFIGFILFCIGVIFHPTMG